MFDATLIRGVFLAISNHSTELQATFAAISMQQKQSKCDVSITAIFNTAISINVVGSKHEA